MRPEDALRLIHEETLGEGSIVVAARMGEAIDPARVDRLVVALHAVFGHLHGARTLDRKLCYALNLLVTQLPSQVESWERERRRPSPEALRDALLRLDMAVDSIFCDVWCE